MASRSCEKGIGFFFGGNPHRHDLVQSLGGKAGITYTLSSALAPLSLVLTRNMVPSGTPLGALPLWD